MKIDLMEENIKDVLDFQEFMFNEVEYDGTLESLNNYFVARIVSGPQKFLDKISDVSLVSESLIDDLLFPNGNVEECAVEVIDHLLAAKKIKIYYKFVISDVKSAYRTQFNVKIEPEKIEEMKKHILSEDGDVIITSSNLGSRSKNGKDFTVTFTICKLL